ncbi:hypothetical protein F4781DRAFT_267513 [Annulohypoxylon bovei var. microspora]|nr:hypothetical protein F4781DRAFT_267513 [Annulohypoxylon bovei var. microspora]
MASSSSSSPGPSVSEPIFTKFPELPPEIRHQIWRAALPVPGINLFNVHCIPNDHPGANRSSSPPWLYLDLRRMSIKHSDDDVSRYDPSAWQAREGLRRVCREARDICTLPASETATITLTRPRRGLFVKAGDGQVRCQTPFSGPGGTPEPLEYRKVSVRAADVLCLSVENCSLNMPLEEMLMQDDGEGAGLLGFEDIISDYYGVSDGTDDLGWTYDPQLTPKLPAAILRSRLCISMARGNRTAFMASKTVVMSIFALSLDPPLEDAPFMLSLLMLDAYSQAIGDRRVSELTPCSEVLWDRFGDRYLALPWDSDDMPAEYRLVKVWPENNDLRQRYLQSALLQSPKRPPPQF